MSRLAPILALLVLASACAPIENEEGSSSAELTDDEVALTALRALGVRGSTEQRCHGACHDLNQGSLRKWAADYRATMAVLRDGSLSVAARRAKLRVNPNDAASSYTPRGRGFLAAGAHLAAEGGLSESAQPLASAEARAVDALFSDEGERTLFRKAVSMPLGGGPRLSASEYEAVLSWVDRGLPRIQQHLAESASRPTRCNEDLSWVAGHARQMQSRGWAAYNRDNSLPMFACEPGQEPIDCFRQQRGGADVFPTVASGDGSTIRVLRRLDRHTYFWMRASADGRFVANGLSLRGQDGGNVSDLASTLTPGAAPREIFVAAKEDPDFSPDNRGFMFMTEGTTLYCAQSVLTNPLTTRLDFTTPGCMDLGHIGLYQTIGQDVRDGNSLPDRFVSTSTFINDNGGNGGNSTPSAISFGPDATLRITSLLGVGTDQAGSYRLGGTSALPIPYEGDAVMSRSTDVVATRVSGPLDQLGYALRRIGRVPTSQGYAISENRVGTLCMQGSKPSFSFDERFMTMHRYAISSQSDEATSSEIWLVDLVTGQRRQITKTRTGEFALYPHFRSDGWLYYLVRSGSSSTIMASDAALRMAAAAP